MGWLMKKPVNAASLFCSLIIVILLAGCAPTATQYAPLPNDLKMAPALGKARICVIRGYIFMLSAAAENPILEDGKPRGNLVNGSYICWERPPGTAHLLWEGPNIQGNLVVEADLVYYLYIDALSLSLKSIPPAEAQKYLAQYPKPQIAQTPGQPVAGPDASGLSGASLTKARQRRPMINGLVLNSNGFVQAVVQAFYKKITFIASFGV